MKIFAKSLIVSVFATAVLGLASTAFAYAPTLSISGYGDSPTINVRGANPNSQVTVSYTLSGSSLPGSITSSYWTTDSWGNFTTSLSGYGIGSGAQVYVTVGGQTSNTVTNGYSGNTGCTYNCGSPSGLSLSQNSLSLNIGQTSTVTIYGNNYYNNNSYYISSNSNSSVAGVSISGSSMYVYANNIGSTTITVCQNSNSSGCATLYVTVGGGSLSLSQNSVSLNAGQNAYVTATNSSGLYIASNSNSSVVSPSVSGGQITLYGLTSGSSTLKVCNSNNSCDYIYVTVSGSVAGASNYQVGIYDYYYSPQNLTIAAGTSVTWRNFASMSHTVTFDASPYSDSGTLNAGSSYTLTFNNPGTYYYHCRFHSGMTGSITVTGSGNNSNNLWFNPASPSLYVGQNLAVSINSGVYNNYNYPYSSSNYYYISSNSNSNVVSASISGSVLNLYANQSGSANITVCHSALNFCSTLFVTVNGNSNYSGPGLQYPGGNVLGASAFQNGELIAEGSTVYIVYKNTKTAFASAQVFLALGYKFSNVQQVGNSGLQDSGYVIRFAATSHPWGSWVKSGQTIYFVHETGLIPVPNWNTFASNGGQANLVVNANSFDLSLPVLPVMQSNDSRLK